jgi:polyribonucleotide nucleotidyltransferase
MSADQSNLQKVFSVDGKEVKVVVSKLAPQANGSVMVSCGGTTLLATAVCSSPRDDLDYFPLQVEYVERLYAGGLIKGSRWVKREGRPSDEAVLIGRLVDRSIRPLFPEGFNHEVQVVITVLSVDLENDPAPLAVLSASAVLHLSNIPWDGPIGAVKVGLNGKDFLVNPTEAEKKNSSLDLLVAAGRQGVVMLEAGANEVGEDEFLKAVKVGVDESEKMVDGLNELAKKVDKEKISFVSNAPNKEVVEAVEKACGSKIKKLIAKQSEISDTEEVNDTFDKLGLIIEEVKLSLGDSFKGLAIKEAVNKLFKKQIRKEILSGKRTGGRKIDELRSINCEVGVLSRTHGSAIFERGKTQVLTVATLGAPSLKQLIEGPEGEEEKRYMHHYSMPPYATGQAGKMFGPGRREIGHGALAERALIPVLPSEDEFPYAIRLVSEVMSSNGSTSMASTCGSTLALMDAGVPIVSPVAGISIGMVEEGNKRVLLTDIAGIEDFNGSMDFKVAGTRKGITAVQVDIKTNGLKSEVVVEAVKQAKIVREEILDKIEAVIAKPREQTSVYAPKISTLTIPVEKIGELIGPGGRVIKKIIEETGCEVEVQDDGRVNITGIDSEAVAKAVAKVEMIVKEPEPGEEYEGEVKRIESFGIFVEVLPGKDGLVHISKIGTGFVKDVSKLFKIGQIVKVKVSEIDDQGRVNLSLVDKIEVPSQERSMGGDRERSNLKDRYVSKFSSPKEKRSW